MYGNRELAVNGHVCLFSSVEICNQYSSELGKLSRGEGLEMALPFVAISYEMSFSPTTGQK
uniref:Uncharacterized protein n=1 Tax=Thermosporothrix sp. COM3 TaxID=2490863 RepID=A0A455SIG4_9CHLR|nr:hypothetical protein KTC_14800 [Thermosporothrix sp. COM3]